MKYCANVFREEKSFILVRFTDFPESDVNHIEVIPTAHLITRTTCYFPPYKIQRMNDTAIRDQEPPDPTTWRQFNIEIIASASE